MAGILMAGIFSHKDGPACHAFTPQIHVSSQT
jgi:hypothetical protein